MQELIKITPQPFNGETIETVNARELWEFLGSRQEFSNWIKSRITEYEFIPEQDFITFTKFLVNGGRRIDYFVTLDMAKELSMVERNAKGRQARRYFIEAEKRLKEFEKAIPEAAPISDKLEATEARAYAQLLGQVRSIYGPMGADKVYRKLPLPDIDQENVGLSMARKFGNADLDMGEEDVEEAMSGWMLLDNLMSVKFARYGATAGKPIGTVLLQAMARNPICLSALADKGILVNPRGWEGHVAFPDSCPFLDRVLACTYWAGNWCLPLSLLPGAKLITCRDFKPRRKKGVVVPYDLIREAAASNDIKVA